MIVSRYVIIDGKEYVEAKDYDSVLYQLKNANDKIAELDKECNERTRYEHSLMDLKAELDDARDMVKHAHCENETLSLRPEKMNSKNRKLSDKIEWYKGQIEAYQHMMIMWSE